MIAPPLELGILWGPVMNRRFIDRQEAGQLLASHLQREMKSKDREGLVLVALPRGGVEVALPISVGMGIPLELLNVRKLGAPSQPELAIGAISSGGFIYLNEYLIRSLDVSPEELVQVKDREARELARREALYGSDDHRLDFADKGALIVDDGIATGATMEVAIRAIKALKPKSISVAVPIAALSAVERLHRFVDHVYALQTPSALGAIGDFYESFPQVSDARVSEVMQLTKRFRKREESEFDNAK